MGHLSGYHVVIRRRLYVALIAVALLTIQCVYCYHGFSSSNSGGVRTTSVVVVHRPIKHHGHSIVLDCIAVNRKSGFEYEFDDKIEAGIQLQGTEVKSCRKGNVQLSDGFATVIDGECWLCNVHIAEHHQCGPVFQHDLKRNRKLLLHKREILKLEQRMVQQNYEIIPISMYFLKNFVKVQLGVGKKKSLVDKRQDITERDGDREIRRVMKRVSYD